MVRYSVVAELCFNHLFTAISYSMKMKGISP